jgi:hypothetical protein
MNHTRKPTQPLENWGFAISSPFPHNHLKHHLRTNCQASSVSIIERNFYEQPDTVKAISTYQGPEETEFLPHNGISEMDVYANASHDWNAYIHTYMSINDTNWLSFVKLCIDFT